MIKRIMIVDDSPIARRTLRTRLPKDREFEIYEAVNGRDGVDKFSEVHPDVTFMDLTMPVLSGFKATEEIRQQDGNAIIIATTADVQPKSISAIMALGAFTLIRKPANAESVQDALDQAEIMIDHLDGENGEE